MKDSSTKFCGQCRYAVPNNTGKFPYAPDDPVRNTCHVNPPVVLRANTLQGYSSHYPNVSDDSIACRFFVLKGEQS